MKRDKKFLNELGWGRDFFLWQYFLGYFICKFF